MFLRAVALAVSGVLVLAGCNGGETEDEPHDPWTVEVSSQSPTATSPSATETTGPAPSEETAKQFIRRWLRTSARMQNTGEVDDYQALTTDDCDACQRLVDRVTKYYAAGGWIETEGLQALSISHDGGMQWTVEVRGTDSRYLEREGDDVQVLPGGEATLVVYLARRDDGAWALRDSLQS